MAILKLVPIDVFARQHEVAAGLEEDGSTQNKDRIREQIIASLQKQSKDVVEVSVDGAVLESIAQNYKKTPDIMKDQISIGEGVTWLTKEEKVLYRNQIFVVIEGL